MKLLENWQYWVLGAPYYHALILLLVIWALYLLVRILNTAKLCLKYIVAVWRKNELEQGE